MNKSWRFPRGFLRRIVYRSFVMMLSVLGLGMVFHEPMMFSRVWADDSFSLPIVIEIDHISPDIAAHMTANSSSVTISATVRNTSTHSVYNLATHLDQADPVDSPEALGSTLGQTAHDYWSANQWAPLLKELSPNQQMRFSVSGVLGHHLLGADFHSGVYPLRLSVSGSLHREGAVLVHHTPFLVPMISSAEMNYPLGPERKKDFVSESHPMNVTLLWPLADRPHMSPGVLAGTVPVPFSDDDLAQSLARGGRLERLITAAELWTQSSREYREEFTKTFCLAIDPDLLVTIEAMTHGYVIVSDANHTTPGTQQAVANQWLTRLRHLAQHLCVVATPYAQANPDVIVGIDNPELSIEALISGKDIIDTILHTHSLDNTVIFFHTPLSHRVGNFLQTQHNMVVISPQQNPASSSFLVSRFQHSDQLSNVVFNPLVTAALAGLGDTPEDVSSWESILAPTYSKSCSQVRRLNALGALVAPVFSPAPSSYHELIVPSPLWNPTDEDLQMIMETMGFLMRIGTVVPMSLSELVTQARHDDSADGPIGFVDTDVSNFDDIIHLIHDEIGPLQGLTAALTTDSRTGLTGQQYIAPLHQDIFRAFSTNEPSGLRDTFMHTQLETVINTIHDLFQAVSIVNPGGVYTLATEHSPLPLALRNNLAVPIRVRLHINAPPGMTVSDLGEFELPPGYLPIHIPTEVSSNQRVAVDITLHTPDGLLLGEPVRVFVHCNAYGMVLFMITVSATIILILLMIRRLWSRRRANLSSS